MVHTNRRHTLTAIALGAALVLSACGASSSAGGAGRPRPAASASGSGSSGVKAKIMVIGDFTSTIPFTVPEIVPTVKGALRALPGVRIETCDSRGTAAAFLTCAHRAISGHVAGVVMGFGAGTVSGSVLTRAGIPAIGTVDATSANSFPVSSAYALYVGLGVGLAKAGCRKLGILYVDLPGSTTLVDYIRKGMVAQGGREVVRAAAAANAPDLAPAVGKITNAGAECVAVSLTPNAAAQALTALRQSGKTLAVAGISAIFNQQLVDSLGPLANGLLVVDSQLNAGDRAAGIRQVAADEKAADPNAKVTQQAVSAWIAARVVAAALPRVRGRVSARSLTAALSGLRDVDLDGVIPPWSSVELANPTFKRLFNHSAINYKVVNGAMVRQSDFYDLAGILQRG